MHLPRSFKTHFWLSAVLPFFGWGWQASAATINVNMLGANPEKSADTRYNDGESMILRTTQGGQTITLSATNYGEDELTNRRWGLVDASKPWNRGKEGALIQLGFSPNAVASTAHSYTNATGAAAVMDASYISVKIDKSSNTLFTSLRVDLIASALALNANAWAGTSLDGFATAVATTRGPLTSQGRAVAWDFTNLNYAGDAPLELRFYGVIGADSSLLKNLQVQINASPVPEASSTVLFVGTAMWLGMRRRRATPTGAADLI